MKKKIISALLALSMLSGYGVMQSFADESAAEKYTVLVDADTGKVTVQTNYPFEIRCYAAYGESTFSGNFEPTDGKVTIEHNLIQYPEINIIDRAESKVMEIKWENGNATITDVNKPIPNEQLIGVYDKEIGDYVFDYDGELIFVRYNAEIPENASGDWKYEKKLAYVSKIYKSIDSKIIPSDLEHGAVMIAYDIKNNKIFDVWLDDVAAPTTTPDAPSPTTAPDDEPLETPAVTPTPAPYNPNEFPAVYEKALNAVYAPAVIESVAQEVFETSQGFRIDYYWQGKKYSDWFAEDVQLVSASDDPSQLIKSSLSGLKRGDVVYMNRSMNGTVKDMSLIYKTQKTDIINNSSDFGTSFEKLFGVNGTGGAGGSAETVDSSKYSKWGLMKYGQTPSKNGTQYAFGVIGRRDNTMLYLLNKSGKIDDALEIQLADNAIVYECNMSLTSGISVTKPLSITSKIPNITWNKAMEAENPTIELTEDGYNYALVRVVDGIGMDVVIYTKY